MNAVGFCFTIINGALLFVLPRRWAPLPMLLGGLFMTLGQVLEIGPFHFTVIRLLVGVGLLRTFSRGELISGGVHLMDRLMLLWAAWAVCSSLFHEPLVKVFVFRLGLVYECLGIYWLMRIFIQDAEDVLLVSKMVVVLLMPLAVEMLMEKVTGLNAFASLGYVFEQSEIRSGKIRAQGPFAHSILAGTAGAVSMPLALLFLNRNRLLALAGLAATGSIIFASASSGPILTAVSTIGALCMWKVRGALRWMRWLTLFLIFTLNALMNDPVYFLVARIDLAGGSAGYYRAALIDAAVKHFGEWWLTGTDFTRNWMATGVVNAPNSADIVNHFIGMGVMGGLLLMLLFIGIIVAAFAAVGKVLAASESFDEKILAWTLGCILFGHVTTFMSVSYFDQTLLLFYLLLASIGSLSAAQTMLKPAIIGEVNTPIPQIEADHCQPC